MKVIKLGIGVSDINNAIREVNKLKKDLQRKVEVYRKRVAKEIAKQVSLNFSNAVVDDVIHGSSRQADVKVSVSDSGDVSVIVADGEDAVWCEFGSGVYHNGPVGSSPNPYGKETGFTIGSYGKGYGKKQAWGYYDENDEIVITRGTPATMPMYNAAQEVMRKAVEIAREVLE